MDQYYMPHDPELSRPYVDPKYIDQLPVASIQQVGYRYSIMNTDNFSGEMVHFNVHYLVKQTDQGYEYYSYWVQEGYIPKQTDDSMLNVVENEDY